VLRVIVAPDHTQW